MSTQLTISIELITFMEWVLTHKSDIFAAFMRDAIDAELREKLTLIRNNKEIELSNNQLYATLNNFIDSIEHHLKLNSQKPAKKCSHRTRHTKKIKDFNDTDAITSPTQKLLYKALVNDESDPTSSIH